MFERNNFNSSVNEKRKLPFKLPTGRVRTALILVLLIFAAIIVLKLYNSRNNNSSSSNDSLTSTQGSKVTREVNKEFSFPIKDSKGKEVSKVKITVDTAELRDQIVVKGKKASASQGRSFLILNLRIKNDYDKAINLNSKDYFRIAVNGNENDWLAPDVHNDPVEVQAISTKPTRVAFPVNSDIKQVILQIGEIKGQKEKITIEL